MEKFTRAAGLEKDLATITRETAQWALEQRAGFSQARVEFKGRNDLVSDIDRQAEDMLVAKLRNLFPEAGFLTEEDVTENVHKNYTWVIDPLDGTTNFVHGLPLFTVSVALKYHREVVLGCVSEPNLDETFTAVAGGGARLNGNEIGVSSTETLTNALLATGFPYQDFSQLGSYLELLYRFLSEARGVRRLGSAALDLAYTAAGRFDGFFEYGLNEWDVAAGALIVKEAGGHVTCWKDTSAFVRDRTILATNSDLHPAMLKHIGKVFG
jgi:myo-inositol-1(or 4)-monophosphatase